MLTVTVVLAVIAGLGLVAGGIAWGYRSTIEQLKDTITHLRAQVQHFSGAPQSRALAPISGQNRG